jgi:hypothetical protein
MIKTRHIKNSKTYTFLSVVFLVFGFILAAERASAQTSGVASNTQATDLKRAEAEYKAAFEEYTRLVTEGGSGDLQQAMKKYREAFARFKELEKKAASQPAAASPAATTRKASGIQIGVEAPIGAVDWSKVDFRAQTAAQIAHEWLGGLAAKGGIDVMIQPRNHFEIYDELAKIAKSTLKDGNRISRIVISGHGSPVEAGFELVTAVLPDHVDIPKLREDFTKKRDEMWKLKEEIYAIDSGADTARVSRRSPAGAELARTDQGFNRTAQFLNDMEYISQAMAENAGILMAICFQSRTTAHEEFTKRFAETMLSYSGGAISSARTAVALNRDNLIVDYWSNFFGLSEDSGSINISNQKWWQDYWQFGKSPNSDKMTWFTSNWTLTPIEKQDRTISPLNVTFSPDLLEVQPGASILLKPAVDSFPDGGKLSYRWNDSAAFTEDNSLDYSVPGTAVGIQKVTVAVKDQRGREGAGRVFLQVKKPVLGTSVESIYRFSVSDISGGPTQEGLARYRHSWSEPPETLIPGRPFDINLRVEELEKTVPADMIMIGENRFAAGVLVTAGREWIDEFIKNDKKSRKRGQAYEIPVPSPQLCLYEYIMAGYLNRDDPATGASSFIWEKSASKTFTAPVPDKISDKTTFETPAKNIDGEQMLVIIYAIGLNGAVYTDTNYLYEDVPETGGAHHWKLVRQWKTGMDQWADPDGRGTVVMR